jgi:hypothetical protein
MKKREFLALKDHLDSCFTRDQCKTPNLRSIPREFGSVRWTSYSGTLLIKKRPTL